MKKPYLPDVVVISNGADVKAENVPEYAYERLARPLFQKIADAFKNPAFQAEFEQWQKEQGQLT